MFGAWENKTYIQASPRQNWKLHGLSICQILKFAYETEIEHNVFGNKFCCFSWSSKKPKGWFCSSWFLTDGGKMKEIKVSDFRF
jgi:hypothetical protein